MQLENAEDLYEEVDAVLQQFKRETDKTVLHEIAYY